MRFIGLTGGIATGKSTVAGLLADRGAVVLDADQLARDAVVPGSTALAEIVDVFGPEVLQPDGALNRAALGRLVFADPGQRAILEAITHPSISTLMAEGVSAALAGAAPLVVADIPLLFENRRQAMFDGTLLVHLPAALQLQRLMARDLIDETAARQRLAAQLPIDDKRALATWVIDNSGTRRGTATQVADWWRSQVERSGGRARAEVEGSGGHAVDEQ